MALGLSSDFVLGYHRPKPATARVNLLGATVCLVDEAAEAAEGGTWIRYAMGGLPSSMTDEKRHQSKINLTWSAGGLLATISSSWHLRASKPPESPAQKSLKPFADMSSPGLST